MFTLVVLVVFPNLFPLIEGRICLGVSGRFCCDGFALNRLTGQCEKCPVGFYRSNCSQKCIPPTYGEDCQALCECPLEECNFVSGCFQHLGAVTNSQQLHLTKEISAGRMILSSTAKISNISATHETADQDFSTNNYEFSKSTLKYLPPDIDLFRNSLVVYVIISLGGVFVFFFAVFVISYIYLKCFRKRAIAGEMKDIEWQAQYKSLSFNVVDPEISVYPEPQGRVNTDFTYLTPVLSSNSELQASMENQRGHENEVIFQDTPSQKNKCETTRGQNEINVTHENIQEHVYIEITEENIDKSNLDGSPENGKEMAVDILQSTSISRESAYTNVNDEEI